MFRLTGLIAPVVQARNAGVENAVRLWRKRELICVEFADRIFHRSIGRKQQHEFVA